MTTYFWNCLLVKIDKIWPENCVGNYTEKSMLAVNKVSTWCKKCFCSDLIATWKEFRIDLRVTWKELRKSLKVTWKEP